MTSSTDLRCEKCGQEVGQQLAGFLEGLSDLVPILNETGYAFLRSEDIPDVDAEVLRRIVTVRDVLLGLQRYLQVCGLDAPVPGVLVHRGDLAEQELQGRHERSYYGPPSRRWAPSTREEGKPEVKDKKQPRKRLRGKIPDGEVGLP